MGKNLCVDMKNMGFRFADLSWSLFLQELINLSQIRCISKTIINLVICMVINENYCYYTILTDHFRD